MTERTQVVTPTSRLQKRRHVAPHRWKGERGCLVGPFADMSHAQLFEHYVLHQNGVSTPYGSVHQHGDRWYISVPA